MFEVLNLIFLGGVMLADINLYSHDTYIAKKGEDIEQVTEISMHREWWREDGKCYFAGLMVPYVRDWEEVDNSGVVEVVRPPEPNKTAGQAILINKKTCDGKEPEVVLRSAQIWITRHGVLMKKQMVQAADVLTAPEEKRPKWLPQVLARIERVAQKGDPQAIAFVESLTELIKNEAPAEGVDATAVGVVGGNPAEPVESTSAN